MDECRKILEQLLQEERMIGATLLVLANKQDLPGAASIEDIKKFLNIETISGTHNSNLFKCSALTGENLLSGMDWLIGDISSRIFIKE